MTLRGSEKDRRERPVAPGSFPPNVSTQLSTMRPSAALRVGIRFGIGAVIAAVLVRTWGVQGLVIPVRVTSGSMAETILGPHRLLHCRHCGHTFPVDATSHSGDDPAICSRCQTRSAYGSTGTVWSGDRLLIDRTAGLLRPLRRWQLVVFRAPDRANTLCLKRIVGLPGESVQICRGDVRINGRIARKSLAAQRAMAQTVYDSRADRAVRRAARWRPGRPRSGWHRHGPGFRWRPPGGDEPPPQRIDWLDYHHAEGKTVTDNVAYNSTVSRPLNPVRDIMLSLLIEARGSAPLWLWASAGGRTFTVRIARGAGRIELFGDGTLLAQRPCRTVWGRRRVRIEWSLFDAQVLLAIDGRVAVDNLLPDPPAPPSDYSGGRLPSPSCRRYRGYSGNLTPATHSLRAKCRVPPHRPGLLAVGSAGLPVTILAVSVLRDVYFTDPPGSCRGADSPYQLGRDEVFVLGDNSPVSIDSRNWRAAGGVPLRLIVGGVLPQCR